MNPDPSNTAQINWYKSSFSGSSGACVEMANVPNGIAVRDSKDPDGPVLVFTPAEMAAWVAGAKAGEFD